MRLSLPGEESKPFKLQTGDTIQFGVDYRGTADNASKCVSMTIEVSILKPGEKPVMLGGYLPKFDKFVAPLFSGFPDHLLLTHSPFPDRIPQI